MQFSPARGNPVRKNAPVVDIMVGIAELKIALQPDRLITLGLGSCVGVSIFDPTMGVGGLIHIMLPDSAQFNDTTKPAKFADLGIPMLVSEMRRAGGKASCFQAKLAGGAQMFSGLNKNLMLNIGERNIDMAKRTLKKLGIKIVAEAVGGNKGRTMILDTRTGKVLIRTACEQIKVI